MCGKTDERQHMLLQIAPVRPLRTWLQLVLPQVPLKQLIHGRVRSWMPPLVHLCENTRVRTRSAPASAWEPSGHGLTEVEALRRLERRPRTRSRERRQTATPRDAPTVSSDDVPPPAWTRRSDRVFHGPFHAEEPMLTVSCRRPGQEGGPPGDRTPNPRIKRPRDGTSYSHYQQQRLPSRPLESCHTTLFDPVSRHEPCHAGRFNGSPRRQRCERQDRWNIHRRPDQGDELARAGCQPGRFSGSRG